MLNKIISLIFPPRCIFCENILLIPADLHICPDCYKKIPFAGKKFNATGKVRLDGNWCDAAIYACEYSGIVKEALIRFKFLNKPEYHRTFAKLLSKKVKTMTNYRGFDIIVSVPLHKHKENIRGYNQSQLISKALSKEIGILEDSQLLCRVKNTNSQSLLDKSERLINVKDAFKVSNANSITGKTVLLVDDVLTTGCTINECCKVLKMAGAKKVIAAVIASGRKTSVIS